MISITLKTGNNSKRTKKIKRLVLSAAALVLSACSPIDEQTKNPESSPPVAQAPDTDEKQGNESAPSASPAEDEPSPAPSAVPKTVASAKTPIVDKYNNRVTNLRIALDYVNDAVIEPGATFSFNDEVGVRNAQKGYKKAIAFDEDNNKIKQYGGGVCQISTTVYMAALNGGLDIVERHRHTTQVPYEKSGNDATVAYGTFDLKFTNNKAVPIKITASMDDNFVYVDIVEI